MGFTVFYAWQSDRHARVCRYFVRNAILDALEHVNAMAEVDDAPSLELDHDTKGVPGIPDVFKTICEKIDNCGIFLADLTFCGQTELNPDSGHSKLMPNSNVMTEFGYALKSVGDRRIIWVMNTAFGIPDKLPFDITTRRRPIQYSLTSPDDPNARRVRKELAEQIKVAIEAIVKDQPLEVADSSVADRPMIERKRFEDEVRSRSFETFIADAGVVAVSMVPRKPLSPVLDFSLPQNRDLRPNGVYSNPNEFQVRGRSAISRTTDGDMVTDVAVLTETGDIFAVDQWMMNSRKSFSKAVGVPPLPPEVNGILPSLVFEKETANAVGANLRMQRKVGVTGPITVAITLLGVKGFIMGVDPSRGSYRNVFGGAEISPNPMSFNVGDETTTAIVLSKMKPIFDFVWREFGFHQSPYFDTENKWVGNY